MRAHPAGPRHGDVVTANSAPAPAADLNALAHGVWPLTAERGTDGVLQIGGIPVVELLARHGSPLFILDESDFRTRARAYREAYPDGDVFYAAKAFLATAVAQWAVEEGLGIDVATGGELAVALRAGVPGERILFHGNNKSEQELGEALDAGVGRFVIDSTVEIDRLSALAAERGILARVLVRVTVGVEAHTHEFIATSHEDQKFGLSLSGGAAEEAVRRIIAAPSLTLVGLHSHIGSQIFDAAGFEIAAARVVGLAVRIRDEHGLVIPELNLGGGMGIAYLPDDDPLDVADMARQLRGIVERACTEAGLPMPRLAVEPGRSVVGPCGITAYRIGTVKPVDLGQGHGRTYVSVDGGMSDNIRTALYDASYTVVVAGRESAASPMLTRVVGKHCESGDVVVRDAWLPEDIAPGDVLAVAATGAYCRAMASQYNYVPRPAVVSVRDGADRVVLRRETVDDLLALDPGA